MENKLFRKSALDRISSPEQLNEYMKVAGPGVWAILAGLAITFAAFFVWGVMGSIPETVDIRGTALSPRHVVT
ncbi:MAG: NHLP bacteriocin system secretion protein, partial [Oscillospiraceae bacterium]|nr:NHLP bacteriocin system secretion protein [Oscillospiraceae bacterium]MDR2598789.1 NHLP bacteriocin system secretion protein [Oscillospiraceae bacterium]